MYLFERQRGRDRDRRRAPIYWLFPKCLHWLGCAKPKLGDENSIQISYMNSKNPITRAIIAPSQGLGWQETGVRSLNQALNPGIQICNTDTLVTRLNACSIERPFTFKIKINFKFIHNNEGINITCICMSVIFYE